MKQTSLFQSWTKNFQTSPISNRPSGQLSSKFTTPTQSPQLLSSDSPFDLKNNLDEDDDDLVLANLLDNYDVTPNHNHLTDPNRTTNSSEFQDPTLLTKLNQRPPVSYRPTSNDSDHLSGFDESQGHIWIYPTTGSFREYQFNIIEQCLFKNTLVCLPTGLGKTFIAAVVMYNFLRWYPTGKLIFMAPTRPLVTQQLAACSSFLGLSIQHELIELTGSISQSKRKSLWLQAHIFFLTPQVLVNDLQAQICPASDIRLLIFDEAHKATGNHAYCQVLRLLTNPPFMHRQFRILALSATPASDVEGVQLLIANLLISHLELRTDTSADVKPYTQHRQIETVVVPLGPELDQFHVQLVECIRIPLERLYQRGALGPGCGDLRPDQIAKYTIIKAREEWSNRFSQTVTPMEANLIQCDFGLVICLLHALELLVQHGLRPLHRYLDGVYSGQRASASVRNELIKFPRVERLFNDLSARFSSLSNHTNQHSNSPNFFSTQTPFQAGHPKLDKLKFILKDHFEKFTNQPSNEQTTRAIVFTQFRDSVEEIMHMLKQMRPLIRPASFIGQSSKTSSSYLTKDSPGPTASLPTSRAPITTGGISQRDQVRVMDSFRNGTFNTLVSTCVGEEGIDVGQVDLIVCFDAFKSPVRLMQRLGRTGRRRLGRIIILLTEGREQRNLAVSMARTTSIHKALLDGGAYRKLAFYPHNPRMIPLIFEPKLKFEDLSNKPNIKTNSNEISLAPKKKEKRKSNVDTQLKLHIDAVGLDSLKLRLGPIGPASLLSVSDPQNFIQQQPNLPQITQLYNLVSPKHIAVLRSGLQASSHVGSSSSCHHLVSIFRLVELHRRNLTRLAYHALGLRSVEADVNSDDLFQLASQTSQSSAKYVPFELDHKDVQSKSDKSVVLDVESSEHTRTSENLDPLARFPPIVQAIVSGGLIFDPKICTFDDSNVQSINSFISCQLSNPTLEPITETSLRQEWDRLLNQIKPSFEQVEKVSKLPSPQMDLKLNIEDSLLEVINAELSCTVTKQYYSSVDHHDHCNTLTTNPKINSDQSFTSFCNDSKPTLAHAFNLPSLRIARSTPYTKSSRNSSVYSTSQVNLDEALALLEQSTVQLDAPSLLGSQDEESIRDPNHRTTQSALFTGPICPFVSNNTSTDVFFLGTKLSFGEDLEDILLPSQTPQQNVKNRTHSPNSSGSQFSQISWSPVSVGREHPSPVPSPKPTVFTSSPICSPISTGLISAADDLDTNPSHSRLFDRKNALESPIHNQKSHHSPNISTSPVTNNQIRLPKKSGKNTNPFILSQAHCSELDSIDAGDDQNRYESSFIDDGDDYEQGTQSINSDLSVTGPDMTAVYLQTIRSPSLPLVNQRPKLLARRSLGYAINKNGTESQWRSKVSSWNPPKKLNRVFEPDSPKFIFSQVPEQDEDYELDSFCVDDEADSPKKFNPCASKRRRRIKINSSESEDH